MTWKTPSSLARWPGIHLSWLKRSSLWTVLSKASLYTSSAYPESDNFCNQENKHNRYTQIWSYVSLPIVFLYPKNYYIETETYSSVLLQIEGS